MENSIVTVETKKNERFLRGAVKPFDFTTARREDIVRLIERMKRAMRDAQGIGLSANQIGLAVSVFIAEVPSSEGSLKFYAIFAVKFFKSSLLPDLRAEEQRLPCGTIKNSLETIPGYPVDSDSNSGLFRGLAGYRPVHPAAFSRHDV